jgi:hypothetical protein
MKSSGKAGGWARPTVLSDDTGFISSFWILLSIGFDNSEVVAARLSAALVLWLVCVVFVGLGVLGE